MRIIVLPCFRWLRVKRGRQAKCVSTGSQAAADSYVLILLAVISGLSVTAPASIVSAAESAPAFDPRSAPSLQGRASDAAPAPPVLSSAELAALFKTPKTIPELLANLRLAWDRRLFVQRAFFDDKNLKRFFDGTSVTWIRRSGDLTRAGSQTGTVTVDQKDFPGLSVEVQINRHLEAGFASPSVRIPDSTKDVGVVQLKDASVPGFTWGAVRRGFGADGHPLSAAPVALHAAHVERAGKVFMRFLYPGDDPQRYGSAELPRAEFLLLQGSIPPESDELLPKPQDTDAIKSVYILESITHW